MAFPPSRNSDHAVLISIEFASNSKRDALFISYLNDYSCVDWDSPSDHLRDVPLEDIFKLYASAAASGIDVYPSF